MGRLRWLWIGLFVVGAACGFEGDSPASKKETRVSKIGDTTVISESDTNFRRFELPDAADECEMDVDCSSAGCSGEVCTTSRQAIDVFTTCSEEHPGDNFTCGCVQRRCRWYLPDK